jgi:hypothetical protein
LEAKLAELGRVVGELLKEGYNPIVYCRFIATAQYVAEQLQQMLQREHSGLKVVSVSGDDGGNEQRREKVSELSKEPVRVLVATDCLSEGINLQEPFNAVVHYDLPWNPNRLEQRIGRVDRFGQQKETVKAVLIHGVNNQIDLVLLDVLLRKNEAIRNTLGVSVPMPVDAERITETLIESVFLRQRERSQQLQLAISSSEVGRLHDEMDQAAEREKENRSYFAQHGIEPGDVAKELEEMEPALGTSGDLERFFSNALQRFSGSITPDRTQGVYRFEPGDLESMMLQRNGGRDLPERVTFEGVQSSGVQLLGRNNPIVESLTNAVLGNALTGEDQRFARCGAMFTDAVETRTAVVVLRLRYLLKDTTEQFAEEVVMGSFHPAQDGIQWIEPIQPEALKLMAGARPTLNMPPVEASQYIERVLGLLDGDDWYTTVVLRRVEALKASHLRLRSVVDAKPLEVVPHTPPDILGLYVLMPAPAA